MAAIGGANEYFSDAFANFSCSSETRLNFIQNIIAFIEQNSLSGIDLDWEFPTTDNKNNFVLLLQELKKAFDVSGYVLSIAVAPDKWRADEIYEVSKISQEVEFINLMTYDLRGPWDASVGHHSQMYPHHSESAYRRKLNVVASVNYWLSKGAPAKKLIVGIPTYGNTFILSDTKQHKIGSEINVNETKNFQGSVGYNDYCATKHLGWKQHFDTSYRVYYVVKNYTWIGFESVQQVKRKLEFVKRKGLGGVMFWSLDTDDYNNDCFKGKFPLIASATAE